MTCALVVACSGYLDAEEMCSALSDLGMLEGMKARQLGEQRASTAVCCSDRWKHAADHKRKLNKSRCI
jgi:hypothetical protein